MKPQKLKRAVIKEELVELTGKYQLAIVLNQMIYWSERSNDVDKYLEEEQERIDKYALPDEDVDLKVIENQKTHGWIYKSSDELVEDTMFDVKPKTMRLYLKELVTNGWLDERRNPKLKMDRTMQYRVNIINLQRDLMKLGYYLEGYKALNFAKGENVRSMERSTDDARVENVHAKGENVQAIPEITTDIKKELTTTTKSVESHNGFSPEDGVDRLANRFIELRAKGLQLSPNDYTSIGRTLQGVPEEDAIHYLETCFRERTDAKITTFSYCEQYIVDSHQRNLARLKAKEQAKQTTSVESSVYKPDSMAYKLASHLLTKNKEDDPGYPAPNLQAWSLEMDRILQEDKRSATDVKNYIDWCKADPHWKTRVENPKELRRNFSKLVAAKKAEKTKGNGRRNQRQTKNPKWLEEEKAMQAKAAIESEGVLPNQQETETEKEKGEDARQRFEKMMEELRKRKEEKKQSAY